MNTSGPWRPRFGGGEALMRQLISRQSIDAPRANRHSNGEWSVWIADDKGERHHFIL